MLLKLMPDQVARYWDFFKEGIDKSLPPTHDRSDDTMNRILESILAGGKEVWISFRPDSDKVRATGFAVTQLVAEWESASKSLLIYAIYAPGGFTAQEWKEGYAALSKYAVFKGCNKIIGYSNDQAILKRIEYLGADISYRFISLPLTQPMFDK